MRLTIEEAIMLINDGMYEYAECNNGNTFEMFPEHLTFAQSQLKRSHKWDAERYNVSPPQRKNLNFGYETLLMEMFESIADNPKKAISIIKEHKALYDNLLK